MKFLLLILLLNSTFANDVFSVERVKRDLEKLSLNSPFKWTMLLSYVAEGRGYRPIEIVGKVKIPNVKFYASSEFKGSPFIELKDDGLYLNDKQVCYRKWHTKEASYERLYKLGTEYGKCDENPFVDYWIGTEAINSLAFDKIEGNVGILNHLNKKLFVDISGFETNYIHKPTEGVVKDFFTEKEYRRLTEFMDEFRTVVVSNDFEKVKDFIFVKKIHKSKTKSFHSIRTFKNSYKEVGHEEFFKKLYNITFYHLYGSGDVELLKSGDEKTFLHTYYDSYSLEQIGVHIEKKNISFSSFRLNLKRRKK